MAAGEDNSQVTTNVSASVKLSLKQPPHFFLILPTSTSLFLLNI